jgi:hypothetical protein
MGRITFSSSFKRSSVLGLFLAAVLLGTTANAERAQKGNLITSINGGISPLTLPRHATAPVTVHLAGRVLTSDQAALPRVNWIRLELAWRGVINTVGLPICPKARLRGTTSEQANELCGPAHVGEGQLFAKIFVPNQHPFAIRAHLIAFNGRSRAGGPVVLVHAYSPSPPISFTIPFRVHRGDGAFRTVLVAMIRRDAGPWPHVANFRVAISRRFNYRGKSRSYLGASCPVPADFSAGFLSFARATYSFADGRKMNVQAVRSCRARESRPPH